jgi:molecular chaperone DnaJ
VEIQEAYDVRTRLPAKSSVGLALTHYFLFFSQTLGDDKKRSAFDKFGAAAQQPGFSEEAYQRATQFGGGGAGFSDFSEFFGGGRGGSQAASDIFETMFGGAFGGGRPGSARAGSTYSVGDDIQATVRIPFLDACKGTTRSIDITPVVDCSTCTGSGIKAGAKRKTCTTCNGTGAQQVFIQNGFAMSTTCRTCNGAGVFVNESDMCGSCAGVGKVRTKKTVDIPIPAGVEDGMRLNLSGMGDAPLEGKGRPGDLHVRIDVIPSKTFRRQGANIYHDRSIPFYTAILGGQVTVPTLDRDINVKVPAGTQPGDEMTLRGRGVSRVNRSDRGDLFVRFNVTVPR